MIWMFERGDDSPRLETRYDDDTSEYDLIVHHPDGGHQTERFNGSITFQTRLDTLDKQLNSENRRYVGAPVLLRNGWKI